MTISVTPLFAQMFIGELDRLTLLVTDEIEFAVMTGGNIIFSEKYVPDDKGSVNLFALGDILEPFINDLCADFSFTVDGTALGPEVITVFRCSYNLDVRAADFLSHSFLSPMQGDRITAADRYETLSLYSATAEEALAECFYYVDGNLTSKTVSLGTASGSRLLNVSVRRFSDPVLGLPVMYVVKCGSRSARFNVLASSPELSAAFIFRNAFNAWETLYLTGTRETSPQYTRSSANVNGFVRNYDIDEVLQLKTYTGPLPEGMEEVAMNLGRSKAVFFLLPNGDAGDEITVTDCDLKHNNDGYAASDLNFSYRNATVSYRLADDRTARLRVPRPPKIFDSTFDQTYE